MNVSALASWTTPLQAGLGIFYLVSATLLVVRPGWKRTALRLLVGALLCQVGLFIVRWYVVDQLPIVTRYEDLTIDALILVAVYLAVQRRHSELSKGAALMPGLAGVLTLGALWYSQDYYPWSPALRTVWLQIHAPLNSLTVAFGTLCASLALFGGHEQTARCGRLLWWMVLLWSAMVATGAYWAHLAWGRYWGWDPIESWSLATALAYVAVRHLMLSPAWSGLRGCRLALVPFAMMLFTTYGLVLVRYTMHGQYLFR